MMRWLAEFVVTSRSRAILVAATSAVLALAAPPFTSPLSYVGAAVIVLAALRFGAREGALVLAGAAIGMALLGQLAIGRVGPVVIATLLLWVPALLLAALLRHSGSLILTLQAAAVIGIAAVLGVYAVFGDPVPWWKEVLEPVINPLLERSGITADTERLLQRAAEMMTGVLAAAMVLGLALSLFLGRAWQAMLYNPGGFRDEFRTLRLKPATAWLTVGLVLLSQVSQGLIATLTMQCAVVLMALYVLVGLALVHGMLGMVGAHAGWLIGIYVALLLAPPQVMLLLIFAGLTDTWVDFRGRLGKSRGGPS